MICHRDMTFCASDCINADCERRLTDEVKAAARKWWGKDGAPIAMADMSGACSFYRRGK